MQEEIWKDVVGYEGLYQVSNLGRVKSLSRELPLPTGEAYIRGTIEMKTSIGNHGYYVVSLRKDGKQKLATVHRLVAMAFIPNPDSLPYINHKDENKLNNHIENLEWCTPAYNANYGTARQRQRKSYLHSPKKDNASIAKYKPVEQITPDGRIIKRFVSVKSAALALNLSENMVINHCKGRVRNFVNGYTIRYRSCQEQFKPREQKTLFDTL